MPSAPSTLASGVLLPLVAVLVGLATLAALAPRSRVTPRWLSLALSASACLALAGLGLAVLASGVPVTARAGSVLGFAVIDLRVDALSALFLVVLGLVGAATSAYGIGYDAHRSSEDDRTAVAYPVFLASLALVFGADDAFSFLLAWELMALLSLIHI